MNHSSRNRAFVVAAFTAVSGVLVFLGLYRNEWNVVRDKKFKNFETDSESLVIARLTKSRQSGLLSENGLLGWGDANPLDLNQSDYTHQYDVYLSGGRFQTYSLYKSVSGTQGLLFGVLDSFRPLAPALNLRDFHVLVALFLAGSLALFIAWVLIEFGWFAAVVVVVTTLVSQWITLFGRNLFYFIGASFLPLGAVALYLSWEEKRARVSNIALALLVFLTVFFKGMMNGYDFIIPALAMPLAPVIYYGIRSGWSRAVFIKRLGVLALAIVVGVAASLVILAAQLQVSEYSLAGGFASIFSTLSRRSYGDPSQFPGYAESLRANPWSVLWTYVADDTAIQVLGMPFLGVIVLFAAATALYLGLERMRPERLPDRSRVHALIAATWISMLSPVSWFVIFKGQAYVHTFTNYLAWHMPFTLFGYALCGVVIRSTFQAFASRASPSDSPPSVPGR